MTVKLSDRASVEQVLSEMTLDEKCELLTGGLPYGLRGNERLGIPDVIMNDSCAGVNFRQLFATLYAQEKTRLGEKTPDILTALRASEALLKQLRATGHVDDSQLNETERDCAALLRQRLGPLFPDKETMQATAFPAGMMLGATWNPELVERCAKTIAGIFSAYGVSVCWGPNVNIQRDPLNGRLFESFSEDPVLMQEIGAAFVKGTESTGLASSPKHYAVNNQETERKSINVMVSERALREIYLPGFEACVKRGGARTVMTAYNKVNGVPCCEHKGLIQDILRGEWKFSGAVLSDCGAVKDKPASKEAGNDFDMPRWADDDTLQNAVESGALPEKAVDDCVRRMLELILSLPMMQHQAPAKLDQVRDRAVSLEAATDGIVLLKNNGVLPISKDTKTAYCGEGTRALVECGAGSNEVITCGRSNLREQAAALAQSGAVVEPAQADVVVAVVRVPGQEGSDRRSMEMPDAEREMMMNAFQAAKADGKRTVLILNVSGPVDLREVEPLADAILCAFLPGSMGAQALANVLYGVVSPSGKLPLTFPRRYCDCPSFGNFPGYADEVRYGEGVYVGYRGYEARDIRPAYAFGHGLSYTRFALEHFQWKQDALTEEKPLSFTVQVSNVGTRTGSEVVQVYIRQLSPTLDKPYQELKAFQKVSLDAGETKTLRFEIALPQLASYDSKVKRFVTEPGMYELYIGNASDAISIAETFRVTAPDPYGYCEQTRFADVWTDDRCLAVYDQYFGGKFPDNLFSDVLSYSPDFQMGDVLRDRMDVAVLGGEAQKERLIQQFFTDIGRINRTAR